MKNGLILMIVFNTCGLFAQSTAQRLKVLEDKIAKTWTDSLTKHIPYIYFQDDYIKVEKEWDQKIFNLHNKDVLEYLELNGTLKPDDGMINGNALLNIATKALTGSTFHMALYGKGSANLMIEPAMVEFGTVVCQCLEQKAASIDRKKLLLVQQDDMEYKYLQECSTENLPKFRSKLFQAYNVKDQNGMQRIGSIMTGYFFTNCSVIVASSAQSKASIWSNNIRSQVEETHRQVFLNLINALRENKMDTLKTQFENADFFEQSKSALLKAGKLYKVHPKIVAVSRAEETSLHEGRIKELHHLAEGSKALGQLVIEYTSGAYHKLKSVDFIPRKKIKNLAKIDKYLEENAEEMNTPPPPMEEFIKNE